MPLPAISLILALIIYCIFDLVFRSVYLQCVLFTSSSMLMILTEMGFGIGFAALIVWLMKLMKLQSFFVFSNQVDLEPPKKKVYKCGKIKSS